MLKRYFRQMEKFLQGNVIKSKKKEYYEDFITFDIEATNIKKYKQAVMYMWSIYINGHVYFGRTWDEFKALCDFINQHATAKVVCFIHNAAYEFQFLRSILDFGNDNVFLLDNRKPLTMKYGMIEFRCSYMLTNMSLRLFLKTMNVKNTKLKYNYSKYRYPWSKLHWVDYRYSGNDVIGLYQALKRYFAINDDDILTTPLTSTGYVRRDIKAAIKANINDEYMRRIQPNEPVLKMCREAFRGGDVHGNRFYNGYVVHEAASADEKSAYPSVMTMCDNYPMTPFQQLGHVTPDVIDRKIKSRFALIMRVAMFNVELIDDYCGSPYLSFSKCRNVQNYILDNGRILECDYLETTITSIDYQIIKDIYKFDDLLIIDSYQSKCGMLPKCIRDEIMLYFKNKETLKHKDPELYTKSKNKLNAIYGMSVYNSLKPQYQFENGQYVVKLPDVKKIIDELISKKFMPYQWGVWVTANARYWLHEGRQCLNDPLEFLYQDTDSIKFLNPSINWQRIEQLNEQRKKLAIEKDAYFIDDDGVGHYLGLFEFEDNYSQFVTLGAKKYCYRSKSDKKLHLTLAGVAKSGVKELSNNIKNFKVGKIFKKSAGLQAKYNDDIDMWVKIDKHDLHITSNVYLEKTTYEINLNADYDLCIQLAKKLLHGKQYEL